MEQEEALTHVHEDVSGLSVGDDGFWDPGVYTTNPEDLGSLQWSAIVVSTQFSRPQGCSA
jgi:hypothetical protein